MAALTAALVAATVASVAGTASSAISQSTSQKSLGKYEAQMLDANSRMATLQADDAIKRGDKAALEHKKATKKLIGTQRAAMAAQGLNIEEDDALAIQQETAEMGALDAQEIKNNAWREAWGYRVQASNLSGQAGMTRITSKGKARQTLLTGGMGVAKDIAYGAYFASAAPSSKTVSGVRSDGTALYTNYGGVW